jgi:hypothetical protein
MLPAGCEGLRVRRMTVWWTFRRPFRGRPVSRQLRRNALHDLTPIVPATAYHRRSYLERYSRYNAEHGTAIVIRKTKYLNNMVEQDHRGVKRLTRPMLGFKAFDAAQSTLTGIELMHMLRKGQLTGGREQGRSTAEQFYALAA